MKTSDVLTIPFTNRTEMLLTSNYNLDTNIANLNLNATNSSFNCIDLFENSTCLLDPDTNVLAMPFLQQLIWSFIFGLIIFISTTGNCIICWIILYYKKMRSSVTNFHLCMYLLIEVFLLFLKHSMHTHSSVQIVTLFSICRNLFI